MFNEYKFKTLEGLKAFISSTGELEVSKPVYYKGVQVPKHLLSLEGVEFIKEAEEGVNSLEDTYVLEDTYIYDGIEGIEDIDEDINGVVAEPIEKPKSEIIDELLDHYNSCMYLYSQFKDEGFKQEADKTLDDLSIAQKYLD